MIAGAFVAVALVVAIPAFGIHVSALMAWMVVVSAGLLYGRREAKWDRADRLQREHGISRRGRDVFND